MTRVSAERGQSEYQFTSGIPALDLLETLIDRGRKEENDNLFLPRDLDEWLHSAHLTPEGIQASEVDLADAVDLREALYRLVTACTRREPYQDSDQALVNHWAAEPMPTPQLQGCTLTWAGISVHACLARIAWEAVLLFGGPDAERIRKCEGVGCDRFFVDHSRSGQRRWCTMKGCGNRAKVNAFNQRKKTLGGPV